MAYNGYKIVVEGTLGADPEVRQAGNKSVLNMRVAHTAKVKEGDQYVESETTWFNVQMWQRGNSDQELRNIAESLRKGDRVVVVGAAFAEAWSSRNGNSGVSNVIEAESVSPALRWAVAVPKKNERGGGQGQASQQSGGGSWGSQPQGQSSWGSQPAAGGQAQQGGGFAGGFDDEQPF